MNFSIEFMISDNGDYIGIIARCRMPLDQYFGEVATEFSKIVTARMLRDNPATYGWRKRPEVIQEHDFDTGRDLVTMRCRGFFSKRSCGEGEEAKEVVTTDEAMFLGDAVALGIAMGGDSVEAESE